MKRFSLARCLRLLGLALFLVCLFSCRDLSVFCHYEVVDVTGWEQADTCRIEIPQMPADTVLTVSVSACASQTYPYQTLPLSMTVCCEGSDSVSENVELSVFAEQADQRQSSPLTVTTTKRIGEMTFRKDLHYEVRIVHRVAGEALKGIREVGLLLF